MSDNSAVTAPDPVLPLPVELAEALDATADAREQWALESAGTRQLYASWVGKAATRRTRLSRAERTATYAATGVLNRSVQRRRDRGITAAMISALRFSLVIGPVGAVITLLADGRVNWTIVIATVLAIHSAAVREVWRHRRAPVAPTMTDTGIDRGIARGPRARRYRGSPRERAGSGRHRQANAGLARGSR